MRPARRLAQALAVLVCAAVLAPAAPVQAAPDTLAGRRAAAADLRHHLDEAQQQAEIATEDYDAAQDELARVTSQLIAADGYEGRRNADATQNRSVAAGRLRALYMNGGSLGLYATVLAAGDVTDLVTRVNAVQTLVAGDAARTAAAEARAAAAGRRTDRLAALTARKVRLEAAASRAKTRIDTELARTSALLADAEADVKALAEQQRVEREKAAARRAAVLLQALPAGAAAAPTAAAATALSAAASKQGVPYVYAATGPDTFDCSGLTQWAYRQAGVSLPRTSRQQWFAGPHVALADLQPGDLLFWAYDTSDPSTIHHVAIYAGDGRMIHAPHTGDVVRFASLYLDGYIGAVRPTGGVPSAPSNAAPASAPSLGATAPGGAANPA